MPRRPTDLPKDREQQWLTDAAVLKVGWVWWVVLIVNMGLFAWGLQGVDHASVIPLSCVWLGTISCCMIYHVEAIKRVLALRSEVEELRRELAERDDHGDVYSPR